ncbi:MAG: hypothetical protein V3R20_04490 [Sphingomonadales bacterium]
MVELLILVLVLYIAFKAVWWLVKTVVFIGLFALVASSLWFLILF